MAKQFYICTSKIEGLGVNAGEEMWKGEIITRFVGPTKFKINRNKRDALCHPDWVGIAKNQWIDPQRPQKFINHSCNPNAGLRGLTINVLRNIKEGDEITIDYSTIEGDEFWGMNCLCRQPNCRGIIKSIQSLPKKQFEKYLPYIPAYFKKIYIKSKEGKVLK